MNKSTLEEKFYFYLGIGSIGLGIILALYLAGYKMFIGGIFDLYSMVAKDTMTINTLAVGVSKIIFASPVGGIIFWIGYYTGMKLMFK